MTVIVGPLHAVKASFVDADLIFVVQPAIGSCIFLNIKIEMAQMTNR